MITEAAIQVDTLFQLADEIVAKSAKLENSRKEDRNGGVLYILKGNGQPEMKQIGYIKPVKEIKYAVFAKAKADFLIQHPDLVSSFQNSTEFIAQKALLNYASEDQPIPGGAIRLKSGWILAFSGFSPEIDELTCLVIAISSSLADIQEANDIMEISGNKYKNEFISIYNL